MTSARDVIHQAERTAGTPAPSRRGRRVLITEGAGSQSRAAVAAVRALAHEGYEPIVTVTGDLCLAASSRFCAGQVPVPSALDEPEAYAEAVRAELAAHDYVAVLPASDAAILALDMPLRHLLDKSACAEAAQRVGLSVPPTEVFTTLDEVRERADRLEYPVVVKPDLKRLMAARADSPSEFVAAATAVLAAGARILVQPYLADVLHGVVGTAWKGRIVVAMHMRYRAIWPQPCGTVASAETIAPDEELEGRLAALLRDYDGVFHADLAGPHLLDLNPRIHATLPLAVATGVNPVARYCDLVLGAEVATARARPGVFFRWIGGDLRSIIYRVGRGQLGWGEALRLAAPRRGAVHSFESWSDPGPMLAHARGLARRLAHPDAIRW